jgi:putative copper export protein
MILYELVVTLHILAAAAWIGGMLFFALVIVPAVRRTQGPEGARVLLATVGRRLRTLGWLLIGVLVVTGAANLRFHGIGWGTLREPAFWRTDFGRALGYKLALVAGVVVLSIAHDVWARASSSRRLSSWSGRIILLLSIGIVFFAVAIVRGLP